MFIFYGVSKKFWQFFLLIMLIVLPYNFLVTCQFLLYHFVHLQLKFIHPLCCCFLYSKLFCCFVVVFFFLTCFIFISLWWDLPVKMCDFAGEKKMRHFTVLNAQISTARLLWTEAFLFVFFPIQNKKVRSCLFSFVLVSKQKESCQHVK